MSLIRKRNSIYRIYNKLFNVAFFIAISRGCGADRRLGYETIPTSAHVKLADMGKQQAKVHVLEHQPDAGLPPMTR